LDSSLYVVFIVQRVTKYKLLAGRTMIA